MKQPDISVIILNFNTNALTRACLTGLYASKLRSFTMEIIVCDNASEDNPEEFIKKEFPGVIFIQNGRNLGFAAGNNPGIMKAGGRYVLLLNSDTEVQPDTLSAMIRFMDSHPRAGAATCKLVLPDGSIDPACHRGFPTPWAAFTYLVKLEKLFPQSKIFGQYHQGYKVLSSVHRVDCISGAFFMTRREIIETVGVLDEDYFMYGEDLDWAYRIKRAGWEIWYNPAVTALHKKKQSGRANISKQRRRVTEIYFHTNNWLFYKKNLKERYHPLITFFIDVFYTVRIFLLKRLMM
jgi:GT2 family glycosyltransferase